MNGHLVFVYGTLRRGGGVRDLPARFPGARFVAGAEARGRLYDLGAYPGLLLDEDGPPVAGEVYEVGEETLKQLDDFEATSLYRRARVEVSLGGARRAAWVYVPGGDAESISRRRLIASGDWVEHARTKADWPGGAPPDETPH